MITPDQICCPGYRPATSDGQVPACSETGMSGPSMRRACPLGVREATDADCRIIPQQAHFISRGFLSRWKEILEQRQREKQKRLG